MLENSITNLREKGLYLPEKTKFKFELCGLRFEQKSII